MHSANPMRALPQSTPYYEGGQEARPRQVHRHATGSSYEGEYAEDKMHGKGTYTYANGELDVIRCEANARVGQGVRWSADRTEAWKLQAGKPVRGIPLDEAAKIAERIGLPPP